MNRTHTVWLFLLLVGVGAVYLPGLGNELLFDDQYLESDTFERLYGAGLELRQRALSYGSFSWVEAVLGDGWWKQRLVNIALHLGVVMALYSLFGLLAARVEWPEELVSQPGHDASRLAAMRVGVALFALNPVAVYAVAYLIQRSILAATLFVVLACVAFSRALISGRKHWFILAFFFYVLAMFSKEHALMAPFLAVPMYVFLQRPSRRKVGFLLLSCMAVAAVAGAVLFSVYGHLLGAVFDDLSMHYVREMAAVDRGFAEANLWLLSALNQSVLFFKYGLLWFVPNVQWMSVDLRPPFPVAVGDWRYLLGALGYLGVVIGALGLVVRRSDAYGFLGLCLSFPAILFATEFLTVWIQDPFVLYRSYLWAIAFPGVIVFMLMGFKAKTIYAFGLAVSVLFSALAFERVLSLSTIYSAWNDAAEKIDLEAPPNAFGRWRPFLNRASYHLENLQPNLAYDDLIRAIRLGEPQGSAYFNLGVAFQLMKRLPDSLDALNRAESMGFDHVSLYFHRGEVNYFLGNFDEAYRDLSTTVRRSGDNPDLSRRSLLRRAEAAIPLRRFDGAIDDFHELMESGLRDERVVLGLAMAYVGAGQVALAEPLFDEIIATGDNAAAYYGRGLARFFRQDLERSLRDLDRAIMLDPGNQHYRAARAQISQQATTGVSPAPN